MIKDQLSKSLPAIKIPKICHESQRGALQKQIVQAWGYKIGGRKDASYGHIALDAERMILSEAEASGTVFATHALPFIRSLWETDSPNRDEQRLNRFLIKLGQKLADKKNRRKLPDWSQNSVDQTLRYIVMGWCERINVDGEKWPPLCCLNTNALATFLMLCEPSRWRTIKGTRLPQNPRRLKRAIERLGLKSIPKGRIKEVRKNQGQFFFR